MKLTDSAKNAIINVMQKQELDPQIWYLEFRILENGAIGLGFTQEALQQVLEFGDLRLTIQNMIDTEGVVVDFGELEDRQGLFFGDQEIPEKPPEETAKPCCGSGGCGSKEECDGECDCDGNCGEDCKCKTADTS